MNKVISTVGYLACRGKKALAAVVGAIIAVGGIAILAPDLPAPWQRTITGVIAVLAVLCGPANAPKSTTGEQQEGEPQ
jgi:ABC-type xylose transport system permease subunit